MEYYTNKIEENLNWKNAGIYADDGKSATNTKKRDDFNAMIGDALTTIRKLKEKNVAVVFEKEGINTPEGTGEILLTILSSFAQEESRNISEKVSLSLKYIREQTDHIISSHLEKKLVLISEYLEHPDLQMKLF